MENKTKRQHYIPQFYLKNFSPDGSELFVYDKMMKKSFKSNVGDVGHEKYFYELPETEKSSEVFETAGVDSKTMMEEVLQWYDGMCAPYIANLLMSLRASQRLSPQGEFCFEPTYSQKLGLSFFAAVQDHRTKESRDKMAQASHLMFESFAEITAKMQFPEIDLSQFRVQTDERYDSLFQSQILLDKDYLEGISRVSAFGRIWMLGVNRTKTPFIVSDHPITMRSYDPHPFFRSPGWAAPYTEIGIPISSEFILILFCPLMFRNRFKYYQEWTLDNNVMEMDDENVLYYNSLQCGNSYRFLYSPVDEWSMVRRFVKEFPESTDPNRQKVEVQGFGKNRILQKDWRMPKRKQGRSKA
jgi:hypothetical protein